MGAILNSIVPKASAGGTGGTTSQWKGPSHYELNGGQPPRNPHPQGFGGMGGLGMDRGTQDTMNQFGQRMDREGFGMFNPMSMLGSPQGGGFNPMSQNQQPGQPGGFNPFSFLGGL